jgi:hypothetical protein
MARRQEHLTAYLRICISERQQNHKKIKKNQERIISHRLKKNVPAGSNASLHICIFLKEITALVGGVQYVTRISSFWLDDIIMTSPASLNDC